MTRKNVSELLEEFPIYDVFNQTLAQMQQSLAVYVQTIIEGYPELNITPENVFVRAEGYGYDGGIEFKVYHIREESDAEYAERLGKEAAEDRRVAKSTKAFEDSERATYERLKKKFG